MKWLSHVRPFVTPWTVAYQAPPSMGFSRQEYWSGVPLPPPKDKLPTPIFLASLVAQTVKNPPAMWETWVQSLDWKSPWRRAWQLTRVFLPGESPGTEELSRLWSMGFQSWTGLRDTEQIINFKYPSTLLLHSYGI